MIAGAKPHEDSSRSDLLALVAEYEKAARRRRFLLIGGVVIILGCFLFLTWQLFFRAQEARAAVADQAQRADDLQASLSEAADALRKGDRIRLSLALRVAQEQTRGLGAAVSRQNQRARPAQLSLAEIEVRTWICMGSAPENRSRAIRFNELRPDNAGRWQREYLSTEVNARSNYRLVRSEIRFNPDEEDAADQLQALIRQSTGVEVAKVVTYFPSPRSISIFFCDGATPPVEPSPATSTTGT